MTWLQSIYFNDFKNGWVVGDCGILFTNDGGENWDIQTAYSSEDYRSIYGIKNRCFWIVGHRGSILYGDIGNTGVYSKNSSELLHEDIILFQCYPNPFNSKTRIVYQLSKPMNVKIAIYNVNGEIIDLLENQYKSKGQHILNWYSLNLPSAVYYCKIECNNNLKTLKLLLLK